MAALTGSIPGTGHKKAGPPKQPRLQFPGGDEGDRTPDLLDATEALSQLSYAPRTTDHFIKPACLVNAARRITRTRTARPVQSDMVQAEELQSQAGNF